MGDLKNTPVIQIGLHAVVVSVADETPLVLTVPGTNQNGDVLAGLPFGPFRPDKHRTLENGLRNWVEEQTRLSLGYVEQLYTFGDADRLRGEEQRDVNFVSVGYLALVRLPSQQTPAITANWHSWYSYFPWEDWRSGPPSLLTAVLLPALESWVLEKSEAQTAVSGLDRLARFRLAFGCDLPQGRSPVFDNWDEERVLERYELMYEAGVIDEAVHDGRIKRRRVDHDLGLSMLHDHRRILATAIARLRGKLKYRPVVFELMAENFTLTELQQTVETLSGQSLHKQNFRRMVENAELVEPTGATSSHTGGRPAAYFRFRRSITHERPTPGLKVRSRS